MKYGFEREFFVRTKGKFVLCPQVMPHDECGYLAESRGEPHSDPLSAAYLVLAAEQKLKEQARLHGYVLVNSDYEELSADLLRDAIRRYGKPPVPGERGNMYGLDFAPDDQLPRAGLHVHFSNEQILSATDNGRQVTRTCAGFIDMPKYIRYLDKAFEQEIKKAKRIPGCYELKTYGFEYRSLPATIDEKKVAAVLMEIA